MLKTILKYEGSRFGEAQSPSQPQSPGLRRVQLPISPIDAGRPTIERRGFRCTSGVCFDDFIHSRIELCDSECLLQIGQRCRIRAHRLVVLDTAPLRVHRDFCSIETPMQTGRNEAWLMAHGSLGCAGQQINESPLIRGLDGEDIDQRDELVAR